MTMRTETKVLERRQRIVIKHGAKERTGTGNDSTILLLIGDDEGDDGGAEKRLTARYTPVQRTIFHVSNEGTMMEQSDDLDSINALFHVRKVFKK